jgi:hypothetical protein
MKRSATTLKTVSARAALVLALAASGCLAEVDTGKPAPGKPANATGAFGVAAAIIAGVEVAEVTYVVSGNGINPLTGSIPLTDPSATISTQIGGLPAGTGYTVTLNATSVSGGIFCTGSAVFDVLLGQTTPVDLVMTCSSANDGGTILVGLDSSVSQCPNLNAGQSASFELMVGESMLVDLAASDADTASLTFSWYASLGTVSTPNESSTTFECTAAGTALLTLTVSDGRCVDSEEFTITCVGPR